MVWNDIPADIHILTTEWRFITAILAIMVIITVENVLDTLSILTLKLIIITLMGICLNIQNTYMYPALYPRKITQLQVFWKLTPLDSSVWHILHPKATSSSSLLGQSESPSHSQTLGMQRKVDVHRNSVGLQVRSGSKLKQTNKHLIKYSTHFFILECKTLKSFYWNLNTDISTILIQ